MNNNDEQDKSGDETLPAPYEHTQQGWIHVPMEIVGIALLLVVWVPDIPWNVMLSLTIGAGALVLLSLMFRNLTIKDEGDHLLARFGAWNVFYKRIPFDRIQAADVGRTAIIDGLGYHWIPFRGWTLNIAGRDCVQLRMLSGSTIRLGTDDPAGLLAAINRRISPHRRDG